MIGRHTDIALYIFGRMHSAASLIIMHRESGRAYGGEMPYVSLASRERCSTQRQINKPSEQACLPKQAR